MVDMTESMVLRAPVFLFVVAHIGVCLVSLDWTVKCES